MSEFKRLKVKDMIFNDDLLDIKTYSNGRFLFRINSDDLKPQSILVDHKDAIKIRDFLNEYCI